MDLGPIAGLTTDLRLPTSPLPSPRSADSATPSSILHSRVSPRPAAVPGTTRSAAVESRHCTRPEENAQNALGDRPLRRVAQAAECGPSPSRSGREMAKSARVARSRQPGANHHDRISWAWTLQIEASLEFAGLGFGTSSAVPAILHPRVSAPPGPSTVGAASPFLSPQLTTGLTRRQDIGRRKMLKTTIQRLQIHCPTHPNVRYWVP